jgi:photosystem II stability/assembly factor-like uncharacterized protein
VHFALRVEVLTFNNFVFSMNSFRFVYFESIHRGSLAAIRYVAIALQNKKGFNSMRKWNLTILSALLIFASTNLLICQWIQTSGLDSLTVMCLAKQGSNLFAGISNHGVYWSTDGGANWTPRKTGLTDTLVRALVSCGGILFAGTEEHSVFRSTDDGASWVLTNNGIGNQRILSLAANEQTIFAGTYNNSAYRSTDQGITWSPSINGLYSSYVRALAVSDSGIFAGTDYGLYRSTDNGTTWHSIGLSTTSGWIASMIIKGSTILASTDGTPKVFRSTNMGIAWQESDSGMMAPGVYSFASTNSIIFAGTYWGFYLSNDNGLSWIEKSEGFVDPPHGLYDKTLYALLLDSTYLFAGGFEKGVWRRPISELLTSVENKHEQIPSYIVLEQNYPNPFNPSTNISFSLKSRSLVSLKVYDLLGREVAIILNEELSAGNHTKQWNALGFPSGVYFYRLQAGSFSETKKLILLR